MNKSPEIISYQGKIFRVGQKLLCLKDFAYQDTHQSVDGPCLVEYFYEIGSTGFTGVCLRREKTLRKHWTLDKNNKKFLHHAYLYLHLPVETVFISFDDIMEIRRKKLSQLKNQ